ncbi:MAG: hypothetical protein EOM46_14915 [Gammaproteobacteria bacterium]|nr:hypothetical protein [Gammaproteobacteria bacterium]
MLPPLPPPLPPPPFPPPPFPPPPPPGPAASAVGIKLNEALPPSMTTTVTASISAVNNAPASMTIFFHLLRSFIMSSSPG